MGLKKFNKKGIASAQMASHSAASDPFAHLPSKPALANHHQSLQQFVNSGLLHIQQENLGQAANCFYHALQLAPQDAAILINLGELERRLGHLQKAYQHLKQAVQIAPQRVEAHYNFALVCKSLHLSAEAETALQNTLKLHPQHPSAFSVFIGLLIERKNWPDALNALQERQQQGYQNLDLYLQMGQCYQAIDQFEPAQDALKQALQVQPGSVSALHALANLYRYFALPGSALDVLTQGIAKQSKPELSLHKQLAELFREVKNHPEAEKQYRFILQYEPENARVLHNLATLLELEGRLQEAEELYQILLTLLPDCDLLKLHVDLLLPLVLESSQKAQAIEANLERVLDTWLAKGLNFKWEDLHYFTAQSICQLTYHIQGNGRSLREKFVSLFRPHIPRFEPTGSSEGLPHLGFLVSRGHEGIFSVWMANILNQLTPGKYRLSLFCDRSGYLRTLKQALHHPDLEYVELPTDIQSAAQRVSQSQCDFLQFWENGTDLQNFLLPFFRLAPIQVHKGWPLTSGNPEMDYYINNKALDPQNFTEALSQMGEISFADTPEPQWSKNSMILRDLSLDPNWHLYFCTQSLLKLHPDFDVMILELLQKNPQARFLLVEQSKPQVTQDIQTRLQKTCRSVYERILFLPRLNYNDYMSLLSEVHISVDPFYYSGSTTTLEACAVGTPVISLPTTQTRGQSTAAYYQSMNLPELIPIDQEDYVNKVFRFAAEHQRTDIKNKILQNKFRIFDLTANVKAHEAFYDKAIAKFKDSRHQVLESVDH